MEPNIEKVKERAQKVLSEATGRASERAKSAVGMVAQETHTLADALRGAAEQAERQGSRVVHEPLRKMADFCEQIAGRAGKGTAQKPTRDSGEPASAASAPRSASGPDATFAPLYASMPPLSSPLPDRNVAIDASTTGGMNDAQAQTSRDTDDTDGSPLPDEHVGV
jgi:hypothetical protein